jgi:hypothetical protein
MFGPDMAGYGLAEQFILSFVSCERISGTSSFLSVSDRQETDLDDPIVTREDSSHDSAAGG